MPNRACALSLCALFAFAAVAAPEGAGDPGPFYNVRSSDSRVIELLVAGYNRSATFRRLVEAIERTDVMVYVEPVSFLPLPMRACVQYAGTGGQFRYLQVRFLLDAAGPDAAMSLIGHELQHVLEVGEAAHVADVAAFEAFYRGAGRRSVNGFDTDEADRAGRLIAHELRRAAPAGRLVEHGPRHATR